jgi:uncharacterized protein (TIGR03066 family)
LLQCRDGVTAPALVQSPGSSPVSPFASSEIDLRKILLVAGAVALLGAGGVAGWFAKHFATPEPRAEVLAVAGQAEDKRDKTSKIDKSKLVGLWFFVKTDGEVNPTTQYQFTKEGEVGLFAQLGRNPIIDGGSYTVEGDNLLITWKWVDPQRKETFTIKELTDEKLVICGKKGDKTETTEFKK